MLISFDLEHKRGQYSENLFYASIFVRKHSLSSHSLNAEKTHLQENVNQSVGIHHDVEYPSNLPASTNDHKVNGLTDYNH